MKKTFLFLLLAAAFMFQAYSQSNNDGKDIEEAFNNPPESTKPWVYWFWLSDNITMEGITKDLEAMAKMGIGEAFIANVKDASVPRGNIKVLSNEWWSCVEHAVREAERLGIKVGMFNCPGWSQSGGPWVKPEQAMRYLATSEVKVKGGQHISFQLVTPKEPFQQLIVQAFPAPKGDNDFVGTKPHTVSASSNLKNAQNLFDNDRTTYASFTSYPDTVEINMNEPFTARSITIYPVVLPMSATYELQYTDKKGAWETLATQNISRPNTSIAVGPIPFAPLAESFNAITSKKFRIIFTDAKNVKDFLEFNKDGVPILGKIGEIELGEAARLPFFAEKQLAKMYPYPSVKWNSYTWDKSVEPESKDFVISVSKVVDITNKVDAKGMLSWDAPEGEWIIQRVGLTPTGTKNIPVTKEASGLEVDKMNKEYAKMHFDAYIGELLQRIPTDQRKGLRHVVADSYEAGSQNWTDGFGDLFQKTYGYNPYLYFPVLNGRIVESADQSDRFLWDVRRLIADCIAQNYVGGLREKCDENGLRLWLENYGHWGFPAEFLSYGEASHDIGGEFWVNKGPTPNKNSTRDCRIASSAGHIFGKNVISAESYTSACSFVNTPRDLKAYSDFYWAQGINHTVFSVYIHQAYERKPGMSAWFGTDFNRHSTWFFLMQPFIDYTRRSHALLQQGSNVADVAYFIGEDAPKMGAEQNPPLPAGYNYDFVNAKVLLNAKVKDGRIMLSSGANYSILVLPTQTTIRPELLSKLSDLVKAGATILGPKPDRSPSLKNFPACDELVQKKAAELWGKADGSSVTENSFGKGRIFCGISLDEAFSRMKIAPDVTMPDNFNYVHRKKGNTDVYFVANFLDTNRNETFSFRISGMQPELWDAISGEKRMLPEYSEKDGKTFIPLKFGPYDSWFIVFRNKAEKSLKGKNFPEKENVQNIDGSWSVSFDTELGAPANVTFERLTDWTINSNREIKYYSGSATYRKNFDFSGDTTKKYYLNLGRVEAIASVRLNGKNVGLLWRYPYQVEITKALMQGKNILEIDIVNTWWNRIIGDKQPDAKKQYTWLSFGSLDPNTKPESDHPADQIFQVPWNAMSDLLPSGLMGPVKLEIDK